MGEIAGTQRTSEVENRGVQKVPFETTAFFFYQWYGYVLSNSTIITFFQLSRILCMHLILVKYIPEALPLTLTRPKIVKMGLIFTPLYIYRNLNVLYMC